MSHLNSEEFTLKSEIQKLLMQVDEDMNKLQSELLSLNALAQDNSSLQMSAKMLNEQLIKTAKEIGINLEDVGDIPHSDSDNEEEDSESDHSLPLNGSDEDIPQSNHSQQESDNEQVEEINNSQQSNKDKEAFSKSEASNVTEEVKKISKSIKKTLK